MRPLARCVVRTLTPCSGPASYRRHGLKFCGPTTASGPLRGGTLQICCGTSAAPSGTNAAQKSKAAGIKSNITGMLQLNTGVWVHNIFPNRNRRGFHKGASRTKTTCGYYKSRNFMCTPASHASHLKYKQFCLWPNDVARKSKF
jgi:hypothetical protein